MRDNTLIGLAIGFILISVIGIVPLMITIVLEIMR